MTRGAEIGEQGLRMLAAALGVEPRASLDATWLHAPAAARRAVLVQLADAEVGRAVARGAFTEARAGYWREQARSGDASQVAATVRSMAGGLVGANVPQAGPARSADDAIYEALYGPDPGPGQVASRHLGPVRSAAQPAMPGPAPVSVYAANPLAEDLQARNPAVYRAALADGPPPTLFGSGDLPPFTASGIDPRVLAGLPWMARHAAASADPAEALRIVEACSGPDGEWAGYDFARDPRNQEYENRFRAWAAGMPSPPQGV